VRTGLLSKFLEETAILKGQAILPLFMGMLQRA